MLAVVILVLVPFLFFMFFMWIDRDTPGNVNGPGK